MSVFNFFKDLFSRKKLEEKEFIELKYFEKYKPLVHPDVYNGLLQEYASGDIIFEPIRDKISEADLEKLYSLIDNSDFLSPQKRFETIVALMYLIDGSFPENKVIMSRFKKIFGKKVINIIETKRKEFSKEITTQKLIRFIKEKQELSPELKKYIAKKKKELEREEEELKKKMKR